MGIHTCYRSRLGGCWIWDQGGCFIGVLARAVLYRLSEPAPFLVDVICRFGPLRFSAVFIRVSFVLFVRRRTVRNSVQFLEEASACPKIRKRRAYIPRRRRADRVEVHQQIFEPNRKPQPQHQHQRTRQPRKKRLTHRRARPPRTPSRAPRPAASPSAARLACPPGARCTGPRAPPRACGAPGPRAPRASPASSWAARARTPRPRGPPSPQEGLRRARRRRAAHPRRGPPWPFFASGTPDGPPPPRGASPRCPPPRPTPTMSRRRQSGSPFAASWRCGPACAPLCATGGRRGAVRGRGWILGTAVSVSVCLRGGHALVFSDEGPICARRPWGRRMAECEAIAGGNESTVTYTRTSLPAPSSADSGSLRQPRLPSHDHTSTGRCIHFCVDDAVLHS